VVYFCVVFGAGFVLGTIRTLAVVPVLGARAAELLELPLMVAVSFRAARWVVRRRAVSRQPGARTAMGVTGLLLMLAAEFGLVLWLRGLSLAEYFASRDPVSSIAYYAAIASFAAMPHLLLLLHTA
jgi:hypothetical protein